VKHEQSKGDKLPSTSSGQTADTAHPEREARTVEGRQASSTSSGQTAVTAHPEREARTVEGRHSKHPLLETFFARYFSVYLPCIADAISHIGVNIPNASTNTIAATTTNNSGSILAVRVLKS